MLRTLGRDPSLVELYIFNTQWSEHCSYKSSRSHLRLLPTSAPWVIQGPQEDAGIVELGEWRGRRWGIVFGHESHNHPSQVVPYEGAATGIGGIIRDVLCMGAHVFAVADALRFGDPFGPHTNTVRYIADGVVAGVAGYGNAVGIPNIAGDVYWDRGFDSNCLVNVVSLGIVDASEVIHSRVPDGGVGWDVVLVGKATDSSGFGGAAFSSGILANEADESSKGAVQVPDPFLKSVIIRATEAVFSEVRKHGLAVGFKDLGAGGIACVSSEMGDAAGIGVEVWLHEVPVSVPHLPAHVIACAETQERLMWIVPPSFTETLLDIYNNQFELTAMSEGAQAKVVGRTRDDDRYVLRLGDDVVCDAPLSAVCRGIRYERTSRSIPPHVPAALPPCPPPEVLRQRTLSVLSHPRVASKWAIFSRYDQEVQGNTVLRPGEGDAGVVRPLPDSALGIALSTDCVPAYSRIDPYKGAQLALAEAARNVAATGAIPRACTDCLNMGDPEDPEAFWAFVESVRGLSDAARALGPEGESGPPLPFVSGNVSFYNEAEDGRAIPPSPIIACLGTFDDVSTALGLEVTQPEVTLILLGPRQQALGGSVYELVSSWPVGELPSIDFATERGLHRVVAEAARRGWLIASHDISDGGLISCISEMLLGPRALGRLGARLCLDDLGSRPDVALFSEAGGIVLAVAPAYVTPLLRLADGAGLTPYVIGETGGNSLRIELNGVLLYTLEMGSVAQAWWNAVPAVLE
ncbi:MAG: phosphoribosylformylglycinamidine synthase subunit PurL [Chloroflexi bacterium]|nr:phosphoribosylformylglycinamidine synthase subunit PurL [Chloroflexota bacterium]